MNCALSVGPFVRESRRGQQKARQCVHTPGFLNLTTANERKLVFEALSVDALRGHHPSADAMGVQAYFLRKSAK